MLYGLITRPNFFSPPVVLLLFISRFALVRQQIDSITTGSQKFFWSSTGWTDEGTILLVCASFLSRILREQLDEEPFTVAVLHTIFQLTLRVPSNFFHRSRPKKIKIPGKIWLGRVVLASYFGHFAVVRQQINSNTTEMQKKVWTGETYFIYNICTVSAFCGGRKSVRKRDLGKAEEKLKVLENESAKLFFSRLRRIFSRFPSEYCSAVQSYQSRSAIVREQND